MDVDLAQRRFAGVNESMRCIRRDDNNAAGLRFAGFITDGDRGATFNRKSDFDVGMRV